MMSVIDVSYARRVSSESESRVSERASACVREGVND